MIRYLTADLGVPHGFFTREGGVSTGSYASLNCGLFGRDDPANVMENRRRAVTPLGGTADCLIGLRQVHGAVVALSPEPGQPPPNADAMVTDRPGLALGIITADCAPVLFTSADHRVVGAAHAGWRGALAGVLEATAETMRHRGALAIFAAIGPCIHQSSYEVGADMRGAVITNDPEDDRFFKPGRAGHWQFDLPGYCAARLDTVGVESTILPHDTFTNEDGFFSHRRRTRRAEGPGGHQVSIIMSHS